MLEDMYKIPLFNEPDVANLDSNVDRDAKLKLENDFEEQIVVVDPLYHE